MYYFVEVSCVIAEMWMIHVFLTSFFERRNSNKLLPILFYIIAGVTVTALSLIEGFVFARLVVAAVSVFFICISLFRVHPLSAVISSVTFCAIIAVTDIVSALAFQVFGIQNEALMENHTFRTLYLVVCHTSRIISKHAMGFSSLWDIISKYELG